MSDIKKLLEQAGCQKEQAKKKVTSVKEDTVADAQAPDPALGLGGSDSEEPSKENEDDEEKPAEDSDMERAAAELANVIADLDDLASDLEAAASAEGEEDEGLDNVDDLLKEPAENEESEEPSEEEIKKEDGMEMEDEDEVGAESEEVTALKARVAELEAENAALKAGKSDEEPKEEPQSQE